MYGVTKDGFKRKEYLDIIESMRSRSRELFGESIDLSERSILGLTLQNMAWEISNLWESTEDVYNSAFVDTAEYTSLDNVGKYIGDRRKPATKSTGEVVIEGTEGTRVPKGFRISDKSKGKVVETLESGIIGESKVLSLPIRSIYPGKEYNVPAMTLIEVVNPISGIDKVYNEEPTFGGEDIESDIDFRSRYERSTSLGGSSTRVSVEAALINMIDVTDAFVEENTSMEFIGDIPPKSLAPYVFGGNDKDIAQTILESKAGGVRSYGTTEIEVDDSHGVAHTIGFTRPIIKDVYVNLKIEKGLGYPAEKDIIAAVVDYVGGTDEDAIKYKGLGLGESVIISKIMASIMYLSGIKDIDVEISLDGDIYTNNNLEVGKKEIAITSYDKVVIEYV